MYGMYDRILQYLILLCMLLVSNNNIIKDTKRFDIRTRDTKRFIYFLAALAKVIQRAKKVKRHKTRDNNVRQNIKCTDTKL